MKDVKCECGHVNPHGTVFCEACGKVHEAEEKEKQILDMRYEGSARRSQTYNKTMIDKIWNFFSSVKVGVLLILITLIASAVGTILPQEMYIPGNVPAEEYYQTQYGWVGEVYYKLGFNNLYGSWWYLILIAAIGVSLVICSLDRVVPLYKALKAQRVTRHEGFLKRQRIFGITNSENIEESFTRAKAQLLSKRYQVREENGDLLAEKGRFSRWGPYVNHVGLIIFLIGGMLRFVPGMYVDKVLWLREGETKVVPETNGEFYVTNNKFILQVYDKNKDKTFGKTLERVGMVAKNYQSNVTLYQKDGETITGEKPKLKKVEDYKIRVNQPLTFNHFSLYQVDYKLDELDSMSFSLENKKTKKEFGNLTINLYDPQQKYDLGNGYSVEVLSYFPDFEFSKSGEPRTKTRVPNNPAFIFRMFTPDKPKGETSFVAIQQNIEPFGNNEYKMKFKNIGTKNVSGLTVRKDLTIWVIIMGGILFMFGVIQGAYWNHRRIWIQRKNGEVWIGAHTNKNWYGLKREIESILADTNLSMPEDQFQTKNT